jgi:hypothetical protein
MSSVFDATYPSGQWNRPGGENQGQLLLQCQTGGIALKRLLGAQNGGSNAGQQSICPRNRRRIASPTLETIAQRAETLGKQMLQRR